MDLNTWQAEIFSVVLYNYLLAFKTCWSWKYDLLIYSEQILLKTIDWGWMYASLETVASTVLNYSAVNKDKICKGRGAIWKGRSGGLMGWALKQERKAE